MPVGKILKLIIIFPIFSRSRKSTFRTFVWTPKFAASVTAPNYDFPTVWTGKFCCLLAWRDYTITACAGWHVQRSSSCFFHGCHCRSPFIKEFEYLTWLLISSLFLSLFLWKIFYVVTLMIHSMKGR